MAPALHSTSVIVARDDDPDDLNGGEIAGAVIGAVVGGIVLSLVLGFLYFRYRRWSHGRTRGAHDAPDKPSEETQRRVSFPGEGYAPGHTGVPNGDHDKENRSDVLVAQFGEGASFHQSPASFEPSNSMNQANVFYNNNNHHHHYYGHPNFDGSHRDYASFPDGHGTASTFDHSATATPGGAASYYDTTIAMDSDPEQGPMAPPTRQMTEMYQEQLRQAREMRKERKNSKGSAFSRVMNSFKRKRSSHTSDNTYAASPVVPGQEWARRPDQIVQSIEGSGGLFEEPQDISEGVDADGHRSKKPKQDGASQDTYGVAPRIDSLRTELNPESTPDPALPSSALAQHSVSHNEAGPSQSRRDTRLKSPEIPEPMDIEASSNLGPSIVRTSNSPPAEPETFVDPMAIMAPTNAREKYAFNTKELVRIENSNSPPSMEPSSPDILAESRGYEASEDYDESDEDDVESETGTMTAHESIRIEGPSDYSTPADLSTTDRSSDRTPDTRITPSPSPLPIKAESTSPDAISASPKPILHCPECGRTFDQIHKLNHHKRYHERRHECPYDGCDKRFGTKTHLDRHINDKHEKKKGFHCPETGCPYSKGGKVFPRKDNWRRHMQNKHGVNPQYEPEAVDEATG